MSEAWPVRTEVRNSVYPEHKCIQTGIPGVLCRALLAVPWLYCAPPYPWKQVSMPLLSQVGE